ncbi:CNP1-like family protein [Chitinibacter sp. SCUT-21]|uniref:CNP1-like family protein n=1 Tax=Chitinibacter sp. SCUT-21 TaxID=2970891 RepID=UPI0035A5D43B
MRLALLTLIMCASTTSVVFALENAPTGNSGDGSNLKEIREWVDGKPPVPTEAAFTLPSVANLGNWSVFHFPQQNIKNTFMISLDSISVGSDNIVRYAMAIKPAEGNVTTLIYEGLDCETNQYRRYASSTSKSEWRELSSKDWKPNRKNGHNAWQGYLADEFCTLSSPHKLESIKKNFGKPIQQSECYDCQVK